MFRLRDTDTGLWYKFMDEDGDIIWTGNKAQAHIFPPDKREFWLEYGDEVMGLRGMERLPGF